MVGSPREVFVVMPVTARYCRAKLSNIQVKNLERRLMAQHHRNPAGVDSPIVLVRFVRCNGVESIGEDLVIVGGHNSLKS